MVSLFEIMQLLIGTGNNSMICFYYLVQYCKVHKELSDE